MDYEVGSIADLISGNHTPNRPKVSKKPLTPVKVPPAQNVTPRETQNKSRTPKLAFTPEVLTKNTPKIKSPTVNQFDSPKSVTKKRKSKLFNNFQFLSQQADHSDSAGEETEKIKKRKKIPENEDPKKIVREYYEGKAEFNDSPLIGDKVINKRNKKSSVSSQENVSLNGKSTDLNSSDKFKKKNKNKNKTVDELSESLDSGFLPKRKEHKIVNTSNATVLEKSKKKDKLNKKQKNKKEINSKNTSEVPVSDEEAQMEKDSVAESDDQAEMTEFQKNASRRIEKKVMREQKFDADEIERTIFVGNVPISVVKQNYDKVLKYKFSPYGEIESVRIRSIPLADFKSKPKVALIEKKFHAERSSVIAYVKFINASSVEKALIENNSLLEGHHLRVDRCYSDRKVPVDSKKTVFLGNLPFNIEEETLRNMFSRCGDIISVRVVRDRQTQIGKGIGFINFAKSDGVELALSMDEENLKIKGKVVRVKRYTLNNNQSNDSVRKGSFQGRQFNDGGSRNSFNRGNRFGPNKTNDFKSDRSRDKGFGKKRDEQGNKIRKRTREGKNDMNKKWKDSNHDQDHSENGPLIKKVKKNLMDGDQPESGDTEVKTKTFSKTEEPSTENSEVATPDNKQRRKERETEFKGLIAKKKKKMKKDSANLKKKKISKILLQPPKIMK